MYLSANKKKIILFEDLIHGQQGTLGSTITYLTHQHIRPISFQSLPENSDLPESIYLKIPFNLIIITNYSKKTLKEIL